MTRQPHAHRIERLDEWPRVTADDVRATFMAILVIAFIVFVCSLDGIA